MDNLSGLITSHVCTCADRVGQVRHIVKNVIL